MKGCVNPVIIPDSCFTLTATAYLLYVFDIPIVSLITKLHNFVTIFNIEILVIWSKLGIVGYITPKRCGAPRNTLLVKFGGS